MHPVPAGRNVYRHARDLLRIGDSDLNLARKFLDDLEKMFLIHYWRQDLIRHVRQGRLGSREFKERVKRIKRDIATVFDLNEYTVKEAVLRRWLFLILISLVMVYFFGKEPRLSQTANILTISISAFALVFLYLDAFVPVVLLAASASLLAICWMDHQTFVASTSFSALCALYFFARLRSR